MRRGPVTTSSPNVSAAFIFHFITHLASPVCGRHAARENAVVDGHQENTAVFLQKVRIWRVEMPVSELAQVSGV